MNKEFIFAITLYLQHVNEELSRPALLNDSAEKNLTSVLDDPDCLVIDDTWVIE